MRSEIIDASFKRLDVEPCQIKQRKIKLPLKIKQGRTWEAVGDLLEVAFLIMSAYKRGIKLVPFPVDTLSEVLEAANETIAANTGLHHKKVQIASYDWLPQTVADAVLARLEHELEGQDCVYTRHVSSGEKLSITLTAVIPVYTDVAMYLPLCVDKLEPSHAIRAACMLMLLIMAELAEKKPINFRQIVVLNLVNGERWVACYDICDLRLLMHHLND